jgi:hypothetical protein
MEDLVLQSASTGHRVQEFTAIRPSEAKGDIERLREELDQYLERMQVLGNLELDEIFLCLSAFTARATELKIQLSRSDTARATAFRNREIEPFLTECDRQFKYYSRMQTTRELDFKISGGQV